MTPTKVKHHLGESLGKVIDIVIDSQEECIAYAIISSGGFLGLGVKLIPVPWRALSLSSDGEWFVLRLDKAEFRSAPTLEATARTQEELGNRDWSAFVHAFYGKDPYWKHGPLAARS